MISRKTNSPPRPTPTAAEAEPVGKTAVVFNDAAPQPVFDFHPLADAFPLMEGEPFDELVADIKAHGLREPGAMYEGKILDAKNRYRACLEAHVPFRWLTFPGDFGLPPDADPLDFVISRNLHRRHLTVEQRAEIAAKFPRLGRGGDRSKPSPDGLPLEKRAERMNVSPATVERMQTIVDHGVPELVEKVKSGELPIATAAAIAKQPADEQRAAVAALKPQKPKAARSPTKAKPKAAPKPKAAEPWNGAALIGPFQLLVAQVREHEAEAARFLLRDQNEDDIAVLIRLTDGFAEIRREPEGEERAP